MSNESGAGIPPFHLAVRVRDLTEARNFYGELLGCAEGRSADGWVDFNFFGHQLVCHRVENHSGVPADDAAGMVDNHAVPVPHFGAVFDMVTFAALAGKLKKADVRFVIEPYVRFAGQPGEQSTMFLLDPSGNAIEFKAFRNISEELFRK